MIDEEEIDKKIAELAKLEDDLQKKRKINLGASLANLGVAGLGILFPPLSIIGIAGSIGVFAYGKHLDKKKKDLGKQAFDLKIDIEKYQNQMSLIKKLMVMVEEHFKKAFKNYNFSKEEELCKKIKLNSPSQMDSKLINELKRQAEKLMKIQEGNHYNILVLGRSGVGKSTLINVVLDLKGDKAAKENAVKPETGAGDNPAPNIKETALVLSKIEKKKFIPVEYSTDKSSLVLLDSRGIEMSKNYNIDIATDDIKQFIEERNGLNSDPDKFVHCIWYLVSGKRFEDDEGSYVKSLKSIYKNFGLPMIFVYTQAINDEDGDLIKERIQEFVGEDINFIQIIARDIEVKTKNKKKKPSVIEAYGIFDKEDGLIKQSFDFAKRALKSSYFNYMKNKLKDIFVSNINFKAYLQANIFIMAKILGIIYEKKKNLEEIRNNFENEFLDIVRLFLIDSEIPEHKENNRKIIKEFFKCFPNLNDPKLLELIEKLKEEESDKLVANYMDINVKAEKEYGIKQDKNKEEIKSMLNNDVIYPIKKRISYIALSYILLKYMSLLGENLYKKISQDFEQSYQRIENKTSEELKYIINKVYDNIMKNCWFKDE